MDTLTLKLAVIDWIAVGLLVAGYFYGLNRGLGPIFGTLLWLVAAMWIGNAAAPTLLEWMPNSQADQNHWHVQFMAYGAVTGTLLALPLLGKVLGRGKKKESEDPHSKHFGSLVGVVCAALFFTLACPYAHRFELVAKSYQGANAPYMAAALAEHMSYIYPTAHIRAIHETMGGQGKAEHNAVRNSQGKASMKKAVPVETPTEPESGH